VGARFSAPIQTSPGAHPAFYKMGTGFFPGVKQPGHGIDQPCPSSTKVQGRVKLYLYSSSGPSACSRVNCTFINDIMIAKENFYAAF